MEVRTPWEVMIADAQNLDNQAKKTDKHVTHMTDALVLTLEAIRDNLNNNNLENYDRDKADLMHLFKEMGAYTIHRNGQMTRICFTAEYDEIADILQEVL